MKQSGIYRIKNLINNRFYIGSSINIRKRLNRHQWELNKNIHYNKYLQNDWNKFGKENFILEQIEICDKENCFEIEQKYLNLYFDYQKQCYNINLQVDGPKGKVYSKKRHLKHLECQNHRKKKFTVLSPNNEIITFIGIRKFCREQNIKFTTFLNMLHGNTISTCEGWRLPCNKNKQATKSKYQKYDIKLVSPTGEVYNNIFNLEQFCREHDLQSSCIRHLIVGKHKTHKNWKII